jgi:hypothetical protein
VTNASRKSAERLRGKSKAAPRRNAYRHGLTAKTVIASLEDLEDYKAFEATIIEIT